MRHSPAPHIIDSLHDREESGHNTSESEHFQHHKRRTSSHRHRQRQHSSHRNRSGSLHSEYNDSPHSPHYHDNRTSHYEQSRDTPFGSTTPERESRNYNKYSRHRDKYSRDYDKYSRHRNKYSRHRDQYPRYDKDGYALSGRRYSNRDTLHQPTKSRHHSSKTRRHESSPRHNEKGSHGRTSSEYDINADYAQSLVTPTICVTRYSEVPTHSELAWIKRNQSNVNAGKPGGFLKDINSIIALIRSKLIHGQNLDLLSTIEMVQHGLANLAAMEIQYATKKQIYAVQTWGKIKALFTRGMCFKLHDPIRNFDRIAMYSENVSKLLEVLPLYASPESKEQDGWKITMNVVCLYAAAVYHGKCTDTTDAINQGIYIFLFICSN